jgi:hypothetical protein
VVLEHPWQLPAWRAAQVKVSQMVDRGPSMSAIVHTFHSNMCCAMANLASVGMAQDGSYTCGAIVCGRPHTWMQLHFCSMPHVAKVGEGLGAANGWLSHARHAGRATAAPPDCSARTQQTRQEMLQNGCSPYRHATGASVGCCRMLLWCLHLHLGIHLQVSCTCRWNCVVFMHL